jgi:Putative sensor
MSRNPVSPSTWRAAWYLLSYQLLGWILFSVALTAILSAATLVVTVAGIPLLIAAAAVLRGCADLERARVRSILGEPVEASYRKAAEPGLLVRARTCWTDPATWRDVAYLVGLFVPLVVLGGVVLTVWITCLAGVTLPLWYWAPVEHFSHGLTVHGVQFGYFPNGPSGHGAVGWYVRTLPQALLAAVIFAVGFILASYALTATARVHARAARMLLRPPQDPLAQAKDLLERPGPLPALLQQNDRGVTAPQ